MVPPNRGHAIERGVEGAAADGWTATSGDAVNLSRREVEVLHLISDGLANREIAGRLFLSEETVKSHVKALLEKLGARTRAHAVAIGIRAGLVP